MILKSETSKIFRLNLSLYFKTSMAVNDVSISKTRYLFYTESSLWKTMLSKSYITRLHSYRYIHFMWSVNSILTRYFRNHQSNCFGLFFYIDTVLSYFFSFEVLISICHDTLEITKWFVSQSIEMAVSRHAPYIVAVAFVFQCYIINVFWIAYLKF